MPRPSSRARQLLSPINVALGAVAIGGVVAAIVVVGPERASSTTSERIVTVSKGVVQSTVSGSGNLSPANTMNLSFGASGKVTKMYVKVGEHVTEGQLLARIDPTSAEVDLAEAKATLQSAQDALDDIASSTAPSTTTTPTQDGAGTKETGTAGSGASGSGSSGGGSAMSEAAAEAAEKSARLAVDDAEDALAATALRAPGAATVAEVNGAVGDQVSGGGSSSSSSAGSGGASAGGTGGATGSGSTSSDSSSFVVLTQLSRMHLEVSLSESDINDVKVGQQATVTVNAASGEEVAGKVAWIGVLSSSSSSTGTSSAVSYPVTIALTQTTKGLRAGMSATAEIVTAQAEGLVVPSQALQGGSVTVVKDGVRTTQRVQAGVAGDASTQVTNGLSAGDQVVVTSSSAAAGAAASRSGGTGGFGGGGLPGGGGPPGGAGFPGGGGR